MKDEKTEFIAYKYPTATVIKFKNRRVSVQEVKEDFGLCFKIFTDKEDANKPSVKHITHKNRLKVTTLKISEEAALALYHCLHRQLSIKFKKQQDATPPKHNIQD